MSAPSSTESRVRGTATTPPAAEVASGTRRLGRGPGFVLALTSVVALMVGASAPSPFYPVLQAEIGFSAGTMTTIFGVYALALLATLLVTGSLSDHIGRRPVLAAGFVVLAASMVGFWHADSVTTLLLSRAVQGLAAGLLMSTMTAAVTDLEPASRPGLAATLNAVTPLFGLAAGALLGGAVLDASAEDALTIVFASLTGVYVVLALLRTGPPGDVAPARRLAPLPAAEGRHPGGRAVGVPAQRSCALRRLGHRWPLPVVGRAHRRAAPRWSVAPRAGVGRGRAHRRGCAELVPRRNRSPRQITIYGTTMLAVGTLLTLLALHGESLVGFLLAAVVAGSGLRHVLPGHHALDHADRRTGAAR